MFRAPRPTAEGHKTKALYAIAEAIQELAKATRGSTPPASALTHDPILRSLAKKEPDSDPPVSLKQVVVQADPTSQTEPTPLICRLKDGSTLEIRIGESATKDIEGWTRMDIQAGQPSWLFVID